MSSLSISLDGDYPFDYENLEEIYEAADRAVRWCRKHMKLENSDFVQHRDDLLYTALLALFQYRHSFRARAFAEAQYDLMTYVLVSIWGLKRERSSDVTRGYSVVLAEDLRTENYQEDQDMVDLLLPRQDKQRHRPVENIVIAGEQQPATEAWWQRVEREILYVLIGQRGHWAVEAILTGCRLLALSCRGYTYNDMAEELGLSYDYVYDVIRSMRRFLEEYLQLGPMMQEMIRLRGRLACYHHDELTPEILNLPRRYVAVFPHGAFTVHCKRKRGDTYEKCLQANRRVNGKVQCCAVNVGQVGYITYERLYAATHRLQTKARQVYAA